MIRSFFKNTPKIDAATSLYSLAMDQALDPVFYGRWNVQDSFEGRFEMVTIHVFLIIDRLRKGDEQSASLREEISQKLFDAMFRNLDDTLREMGVGDISVARKIRAMAEAFYGRSGVYDKALHDEYREPNEFIKAISKNIYALEEGHEHENAQALADYVERSMDALDQQPSGRITAGIVKFPNVLAGQTIS